MKRHAILTFAAIVVLLACNHQTETHKASAKPVPWNMSLQTQPETLHMNKEANFRVTMTDKQGRPVKGAQVEGALVMSTMDMGKNEFKFAEQAPGVYQGTARMDMAGPWELVVSAKAGGIEGQKKFELGVRE